MSGVECIIPGFAYTEDDSMAKYANGKKFLKGKHVKKLTETRRHSDKKSPADCSKKKASGLFKNVYLEDFSHSVNNGFELFSRINDGKHSISGKFPRSRSKLVWHRMAEEQLAEMPLMGEPIEEEISQEEADYLNRKSRAEALIKELQNDISGQEKFYYAAGKEFYHVLWHLELDDPYLIEVLTTFTDEEWEAFVKEIDGYYDPTIWDMYCDF